MAVEQYIESYYLGEGMTSAASTVSNIAQSMAIAQTTPIKTGPYRLSCFRTTGTVSPDSQTQLRLYFLSTPQFVSPNVAQTETKLELVADVNFLSVASGTFSLVYLSCALTLSTRHI